MEDTWIAMMRQYEQGPGSILVNTRVRDDGPMPDSSRPVASIIKVKFNEPEQSGMGSTEDAAAIDEAWEAIAPEMFSEAGAEHFSRLRHDGEARFLLYSDGTSRAKIEELARRGFAPHAVRVEHRDDAKWELYQASLPTPSEERLALDYLVVQALEQHGDPLTPKRDVCHFAYFPDRQKAEAFASRVSTDGFKVEVEQVEGEQHWLVTASRDDSVSYPEITQITGPLADLVDELGGTYDGWEAMLVKKKSGLLGRLFGR